MQHGQGVTGKTHMWQERYNNHKMRRVTICSMCNMESTYKMDTILGLFRSKLPQIDCDRSRAGRVRPHPKDNRSLQIYNTPPTHTE